MRQHAGVLPAPSSSPAILIVARHSSEISDSSFSMATTRAHVVLPPLRVRPRDAHPPDTSALPRSESLRIGFSPFRHRSARCLTGSATRHRTPAPRRQGLRVLRSIQVILAPRLTQLSSPSAEAALFCHIGIPALIPGPCRGWLGPDGRGEDWKDPTSDVRGDTPAENRASGFRAARGD